MLEGRRDVVEQLDPADRGPKAFYAALAQDLIAVQLIVNEAARALPAEAAELRGALAAAARTLEGDLEVVRTILDTAVIQSYASPLGATPEPNLMEPCRESESRREWGETLMHVERNADITGAYY